MDRAQQIFDAFVQANELELKPIFAEKKVLYLGLRRDPMTREEITGTVEYAAFVDGFEGNAVKYQGPKGSRKNPTPQNLPIDSVELEVMTEQMIEQMGFDQGEISIEANKKTDEQLYGEQYQLGWSMRF